LAEYTEFFTYAEIRNVIDIAARYSANSRINISTSIIIDKILENPPILNEESIDMMRNWQ